MRLDLDLLAWYKPEDECNLLESKICLGCEICGKYHILWRREDDI